MNASLPCSYAHHIKPSTGAALNFLHNGLVAQLSVSDQALLARCCTQVQLEAGHMLATPRSKQKKVYFLTGASVALVVRDKTGVGLAMGLVGQEGATNLQLALGYGMGVLSSQVQCSGMAWQADGLALERLVQRRASILLVFSRYIWQLAQDIAAWAVCTQTHNIKARLASWILISASRSDPAAPLCLTHAHLADMLGVRRASVTLAAVELKALGLLDYTRGRMHIRNAKGLKALACWRPEIFKSP